MTRLVSVPPITRHPSPAPSAGWQAWRKGAQRLWRNPLTLFGLLVLLLLVVTAIAAPLIAPADPTAMKLGQRLRPPGSQFLFGTDELGRDILSRILWGTRVSLQIGVIVIGIAASLGFTLGSMSGYFRGPFDGIVMRVMDIILAFPPLILAMAIASFLGPDLNNAMLAIAVVHIPKYTRLARSEALALRESLFVLAARSTGASDRRIILRHIMPNSLASILIVASLDFGLVILTAASLGFIGLGAQPPTPEWGLMVADGRKYLVNAPWVATFPGLTIVLVVIAANVFGDGLRDVLDPRLRT
ncbi:MAG: ABC transporter permease [Anaerolineae bacterium]|nr:ABC transporter permease [Anaerolineae bacterium]